VKRNLADSTEPVQCNSSLSARYCSLEGSTEKNTKSWDPCLIGQC